MTEKRLNAVMYGTAENKAYEAVCNGMTDSNCGVVKSSDEPFNRFQLLEHETIYKKECDAYISRKKYRQSSYTESFYDYVEGDDFDQVFLQESAGDRKNMITEHNKSRLGRCDKAEDNFNQDSILQYLENVSGSSDTKNVLVKKDSSRSRIGGASSHSRKKRESFASSGYGSGSKGSKGSKESRDNASHDATSAKSKRSSFSLSKEDRIQELKGEENLDEENVEVEGDNQSKETDVTKSIDSSSSTIHEDIEGGKLENSPETSKSSVGAILQGDSTNNACFGKQEDDKCQNNVQAAADDIQVPLTVDILPSENSLSNINGETEENEYSSQKLDNCRTSRPEFFCPQKNPPVSFGEWSEGELSENDIDISSHINPAVTTKDEGSIEYNPGKPSGLTVSLLPQNHQVQKPFCFGFTSNIDLQRMCFQNENLIGLVGNPSISPDAVAQILANSRHSSEGSIPTSPNNAVIPPVNDKESVYPLPTSDNCRQEYLEQACRCDDSECHVIQCRQNKYYLNILGDCLREPYCLYPQECDIILRCLYDHHTACSEVNCDIRYCFFFTAINARDFKEAKGILRERMSNSPYQFTCPFNKHGQLLKLCDGWFYKKSTVEEGIDWYTVTELTEGKFGKIVLALGEERQQSSSSWVVKKWTNWEISDLCNMFKNINHPHIVCLLWAQKENTFVNVCSPFESGSLKERLLQLQNVHGLCMLTYIRQFLSAAEFLHERSIIYLAWLCSNVVLMSNSYQHIKLSNLSCAVDLDKYYSEEEIEDVYLRLPWQITPIELLNLERPTRQNDSYGIGCIILEMVSGHLIHHKFRHENPEIMREEVKSLSPLDYIPTDSRRCGREFLKECFQEFSSRKTAAELQRMIGDDRNDYKRFNNTTISDT